MYLDMENGMSESILVTLIFLVGVCCGIGLGWSVRPLFVNRPEKKDE
jgi:hypothetical protein